MLETLLHFFKTTFYCLLYLSYTLVSIFESSLHYLIVFVGCSLGFLSALYELISKFIQDNLHLWQQLLAVLASSLTTIYTSIPTLLNKSATFIKGTLHLMESGLTNGISALIYSKDQLFVLAEKLTIPYESGVWFLKTSLYYFMDFLSNLYKFLSRFIQDSLHLWQQLLTVLATSFDIICTSTPTILNGSLHLIESGLTTGISALIYCKDQLFVLVEKLTIAYETGELFLNTLQHNFIAFIQSSFDFLGNLYEFLSICIEDTLIFWQLLLATVYNNIFNFFYKTATFIYLTVSTENVLTNRISDLFYCMDQLILLFANKLNILFECGVWFLNNSQHLIGNFLEPLGILYESLLILVKNSWQFVEQLLGTLATSFNKVNTPTATNLHAITTANVIPKEKSDLSFMQGLCHEIFNIPAAVTSYIKTLVREKIFWESLCSLSVIVCVVYFVILKVRQWKNWFRHARCENEQLQNQASGDFQPPTNESYQQRQWADQTSESLLKLNQFNTCVICQRQLKCILLLPCKHLCLCEECSAMLRNYNNKCPVCRSNIYNRMKVYT